MDSTAEWGITHTGNAESDFPRVRTIITSVCQRRNKQWFNIWNEQQYGRQRILNLSNALNYICASVFCVSTNESIIKAKSIRKQRALWRMWIECNLRDRHGWTDAGQGLKHVTLWHKTDGLKGTKRQNKKIKVTTLKHKITHCRIWETFLPTVRQMELY